MKYFIAIASAIVVLFNACSPGSSKGVTEFTAVQFDSALQSTASAMIIDVRTPEEFQGGHIDGALNYDWNGNTFGEDIAGISKSSPVFVYCRSGSRSASAADYMTKEGFTSVYTLDGGITAWQNAGLTVIEEDKNTTINSASGEITVAQYNKLIAENDVVLVDFAATWCGPCKILAPRLHELENELSGQFVLVKADVDRDADLANYMNIAAMPTLVLYKKGELKWRNEGLVPKEMVADKIKSIQ